MRKIISAIVLLLLAWSCSPTQKAGSSDRQSTIKSDSAEYEITIIDNEFDHWYLLNFSPAKDHSNEYYRNKNQAAVVAWNGYFTRNRYHRIIEDYIYFNNSIDYGMEVNRKLYWYFKFIEETYRIRLLY
ncbi:MAG: DUF6146 family protein [Bacteroidales bacterium]|nr:DUF6146 family protein [Bacteroidales bacterium]